MLVGNFNVPWRDERLWKYRKVLIVIFNSCLLLIYAPVTYCYFRLINLGE